MTRSDIIKQVSYITSKLIAVSLSEEQNFPSENNGEIYISGNHDLSVALKNLPYADIYNILEKTKNYNIKMIDGALIQLMYSFDGNENLLKYRLAFFPSPTLEEFQNNSEVYELDEIYADMIDRNIVAVPVRFDYNPSDFKAKEHPCSHLTLGQYKNCRIPVQAPITPNIFIDFILRNFYNTAKRKFSEELNFDIKNLFDNTIDNSEKKLLHISIEK